MRARRRAQLPTGPQFSSRLRQSLGRPGKALHHLEDHLACRLHGIHPGDDLTDRNALQLGHVGASDATLGISRQHVLQRHRQRARRFGRLPGLRPRRAQLPGRLARERPGAGRVAGAGGEELRDQLRRHVALGRRQPDRPAPDALGAESESRRDLPAVADAAGGQHRDRRHGVDDVGHEHHRGDLTGVARRPRSRRRR